MKRRVIIWSCAMLLGGCEHFRDQPTISDGHLQASKSTAVAGIPEPVRMVPALPPPAPYQTEPSHTVVVNNVPTAELLFSLARDSDLNLDIDPDVGGTVTLNAINQPLPAILDRIADSADLRYEIKNDVLRVRKDSPFLRNYRIDYLNMARTSSSTVRVSTQISATGQGAGEEGGSGGGGDGDNNSLTEVTNTSDHSFWKTLQGNIAAIIDEGATSAAAVEGNHPHIMLNRESGVIGVRATDRQHKAIQMFLDEVLISSQRQVLIEATIAEVKLNDRYQAGIDWSLVRDDIASSGTDASQLLTDIGLFRRPTFTMTITDIDVGGNVMNSTLSALETFGDVSIMSSPKVMALNNQTALLKVVDNLVYFNIEVNIDQGNEDTDTIITYETEINTVPVGFVMSVTPFIGATDSVTLNLRPTISRVVGQVRDPNPALAEANVISEIPIIQVREVESVLKVGSGDIAVLGGLMQDEISKNSRGIPVLSSLPWIGALFRYQDDENVKTELVIFIKPVVVQRASVDGDLGDYRRYLPKPTAPSNEQVEN